jgi:GTP-binding protein LepA
MKPENIRNFCIIAHIDHGKSTLADRFIEISGSVRKEKMGEQMLDTMELEKERGITIKLKAIRMAYSLNDEEYELNLIDTPGHVDFGYEVSRSLAACEGALLLVDASQGVQAQTLVNLQKAREHNLKIIPVVNKVDLPSASPEEAALQLIELGFEEDDICYTSGKTGKGVDILLEKIIKKIPSPKIENETESKALVFDSAYDDYRGVVVFVRVFNGSFKYNQQIKFCATGATSNVIEIGYLAPMEVRGKELLAGEVGFLATGLKDIMQARVGDTVTLATQNPKPIAGYDVPVPMVFMSFYPSDSSRYLELREAMDRLSLNDAAFSFEPESIGAIGKGFRCGFLGLLHSDIVRERIEREFNIDLITTSPSVKYILEKTDGSVIEIKSAAEFPEVTTIKEVREPWAALDVYVTSEYLSAVMDLCKKRRSTYLSTTQIDGQRYKISYEIPLVELIIDFYDKLKSISSGYASIDYKITDYRASDVVKLNILIAGDVIHPLAQLVQRENAQEEGNRIVAKLKDLIPRQQFSVSLQAAINEKIVAREDISPVRKDVTGYLYGGDVTRKNKLLDKQKKGKKNMKRFGKVDVPQDVFWKVMER